MSIERVVGAEPHDRALAEALLDLRERVLERLLLVHRSPFDHTEFRLVVMAAPPYGMRETFSISTYVYTICSCWGRVWLAIVSTAPCLCSSAARATSVWQLNGKREHAAMLKMISRLLAAGVLGLLAFFLLVVDPENSCRLRNVFTRDATATVMAMVQQPEMGILDFRGSTSAYTEVCLVEIDEAGVYGFPPGINQKPPALLGKELCAGWRPRKNRARIVGSGPNGDVHAFSTFTFSELPTNTIVDRSRRCAPLRRAVLQCVDAGPSGTHCGFVDGLGG